MRTIFYSVMALLLIGTSCLKKVEEVDQLTTNIFDPAYDGEKWFEVDDFYQYTNDLGQERIKVKLKVLPETSPSLKLTSFPASLSGSSVLDDTVVFVTSTNGFYRGETDLKYTEAGTYCVTIGMLVTDDPSVKKFSECITL